MSRFVDNRKSYQQKKENLLSQLKISGKPSIGLNKSTSNLFRHRGPRVANKIQLNRFNQVVSLDPDQQVAEVEGVATYETIVDALLPHGFAPTVVPELKTITLGGAVTGIGIESSSFRYGLVHETVRELEVLTGNGEIVRCAPDNEHSGLFFGFPNSYGTLGYALKVKVMVQPVKPYLRLQYLRYDNFQSYFAGLGAYCDEKDRYAFIDGVVFSEHEMYITLARFTDEAPFTSDYTYLNIYYRSIREKSVDYLTVHDYLWRWDTDWFWCSNHFLAQNPMVRRLFGRKRLRSTTYWGIRNFCSRHGITALMEKLSRRKKEAVIQDVEIPLAHCEEFIRFFVSEIGITPVWACPTRAYDSRAEFSLYPMNPETLYVNFGFWDVVSSDKGPGHYNRLIEEKVESLGGKKSLYSSSYYSKEKFWQLYDKKSYDKLRNRYDPGGSFKDLYSKCVRAD
ncbi:FAD-dependent oxidoreductase [Fibrobacterota bacterium]